jgi:hypothetical protein
MPSRFHVTRNLRGHFFSYHQKKVTLQKLWPPKISCATGNRLGMPGALNTKPYILPKLPNTKKRRKNAFEVCQNAAFVISFWVRPSTLTTVRQQVLNCYLLYLTWKKLLFCFCFHRNVKIYFMKNKARNLLFL